MNANFRGGEIGARGSGYPPLYDTYPEIDIINYTGALKINFKGVL